MPRHPGESHDCSASVPAGNLRTTPVYAGLLSQVFALCLLTPTRRAYTRSVGVSNSLIWKGLNGAQDRNRTSDTVIFSHVLYQLSYLGTGVRRPPRGAIFSTYRGGSQARRAGGSDLG